MFLSVFWTLLVLDGWQKCKCKKGFHVRAAGSSLRITQQFLCFLSQKVCLSIFLQSWCSISFQGKIRYEYIQTHTHTHTHTQPTQKVLKSAVYDAAYLLLTTSGKPLYTHRPVGRYRGDGEIMELKCPLPWPAKVEGDNYICPNCFHSNIPLSLLFLFFLGGQEATQRCIL